MKNNCDTVFKKFPVCNGDVKQCTYFSNQPGQYGCEFWKDGGICTCTAAIVNSAQTNSTKEFKVAANIPECLWTDSLAHTIRHSTYFPKPTCKDFMEGKCNIVVSEEELQCLLDINTEWFSYQKNI